MEPREPLVRPSFDEIYMDHAINMARRSTCRRTSSTGKKMAVGCAIVTEDYQRVIASGYNGNAAGLPNDCDSEEPGSCGCIHAESNAVIKCREPRETPKIVYATHLPCKMCSKQLINLGGVRKVLYLNDYRIKDSIQLLKFVGIEIERFYLDKYKELVT